MMKSYVQGGCILFGFLVQLLRFLLQLGEAALGVDVDCIFCDLALCVLVLAAPGSPACADLAEDGALAERVVCSSGVGTYNVEFLLEGLRRLESLVSDMLRPEWARRSGGPWHTLTTDLVKPFQDIVGRCGRGCGMAMYSKGVWARRTRGVARRVA